MGRGSGFARTQRAPREFVVKNLADNIVRSSPGYLVIVDAHENRLAFRRIVMPR
jgi:hypothetical protein